MNAKDSKQIAMHISRVSIVANVGLSVMKMAAGIFAHSTAMISDAIHSLSDVLSTFVVMIGIQISSKDSDERHPYGHERFECVASIVLSTMLAVTGLGLGYSGIRTVLHGADHLKVPGMAALIAAVISIVVKEIMFWYTKAGADKINSGALLADAWHHRSDALSSVGSLAGIGAARLGYPLFDPLASILICMFILKAAYEIFTDAVDKMVDAAVEDTVTETMKTAILAQKGVLGIDVMRTRMFGSKYYVDVEISVDGNMTLREAHDIAHGVHDKIESTFKNVKHVMVHVNPKEDSA